ncbi:MAG: hypothetical protein HC869_11795 [Rhodospirillales bacterium]|nr:hypothetical protein [Rhodospirillales bacterium]
MCLHEIGHALGLGHPNDNNVFGAQVNFDTNTDPLDVMPIDPSDPFAELVLSSSPDNGAVMSNNACGGPALCAELLLTSLRNDDAGGRDALYPLPVPEPTSLSFLLAATIVTVVRRRVAYAHLSCDRSGSLVDLRAVASALVAFGGSAATSHPRTPGL